MSDCNQTASLYSGAYEREGDTWVLHFTTTDRDAAFVWQAKRFDKGQDAVVLTRWASKLTVSTFPERLNAA